MTETELSARIRDSLKVLNFWVMRIQSGSVRARHGVVRLAEPGTPDLHLVEHGAWLEVKRPGKALNANQIAWHKRAKKAGVRVHTIDSVGEAVRVALAWRAEDLRAEAGTRVSIAKGTP